MSQSDNSWIADRVLVHSRMTLSVVAIIKGLLSASGIPFLAVEGRTKAHKSIEEKIKRKGYKQPQQQITDITGIRVILYFESDVHKVSDLIVSAFSVDEKQSLDKSALLAVDRIGYRSVHYVCDLGRARAKLPEYEGMAGLKFEVQIRTVLQHAWAEIAHDRNYKFSGKLPPAMERELHLYAGMLEVADKGFDKLSKEIDSYSREVTGGLAIEGDTYIDSISLPSFIERWCKENNCRLRRLSDKTNYAVLVEELNAMGIENLSQLEAIIPSDYAAKCAKYGEVTTVYGHVRNWLLIHDWRRYVESVQVNWVMSDDSNLIRSYISERDAGDFLDAFEWESSFDIENGNPED